MEEKKIVIRLPQLAWKSFLNVRMALLTVGLSLVLGGFYWNQKIRPFLWIDAARVHLFSLTIPSERAGRISEIAFEEGDFVQKGQILFSLHQEDLILEQRQKQAQIQSLQEQARLEKVRMDKTMHEYLVASTELDMGLGSADSLQNQLQLLDEAQSKSEALEKEAARCQSELHAYQTQIEKMKGKAPFAGKIFKQMKKLGEAVGPGEPIVLFSDPSRVWVEVAVPEKQIHLLAKGTLARIRISAYPKKEWEGEVTWIGPMAYVKDEPLSKGCALVPVRVSFKNKEETFVDGLSAQVGFQIR